MLLAEQGGSIWPLAGVVVAMLLLLLTFWRISRRAASRWEPPPSHPWNSTEHISAGMAQPEGSWLTGRASSVEAPASLTAWEVQMHETARELSALVDTKLRLLQQLVAEADRAATRLEQALAAAQTAQAEPAGLGSGAPANPSRSEGATAPPRLVQSEAASNPLPLGSPDRTTRPPSPVRPEVTPSPLQLGDTQQAKALSSAVRPEALDLEVGLLADYGFPLQEIASRCGISVSEVETILRRRHP